MRRVATILVVAAVLGAGAARAEPAEKKFKSWTVGALQKGEGLYAATANDSGGVLAQFCYREIEKCVWVLANDIKCDEDHRYPVLVNADSGALSTQIVCVKVGSSSRYAFTDFDRIDKAILESEWIGFAFPMASGKFTVSRFSLAGAKEAVAFMRKAASAAIDQAKGTMDQTF